MEIDIHNLVGEATAYDKKQLVEAKRPKSWLKSVSAFANGEGGVLVFGISDNGEIIGLQHAEEDGETISECIKTKLDPIPTIELEYRLVGEAKLILLHVKPGDETPYYYIGDKQRIAYIRIGNESVVADRLQLRNLVMNGSSRSYDALPSCYRFEDMSFTRLKSIHFKRLGRHFEDNEFISWGIIGEDGRLTNAGALIADDSPIRHSRIFCTRWNGLNMTSGLGEAIDDVELEGCIIGQLQDAVSFAKNNSHKIWWKEADHREEQPDYPIRAVTESIVNAIIHRSYLEVGSEVHVDIYDNRIEIYSPGGMMDGRLIQQLDPLTIPSKRRNPLLADIFSRLNLMERRGSGIKKIINAYKQYEHLPNYHAPSFTSNASEFHVTLWNLNYQEFTKEEPSDKIQFTKEELQFTKEEKQFTKEDRQFTKEERQFTKEEKPFFNAKRKIYRYIAEKPKITTIQMAERMGLSKRQVLKYIKRLTEMNLIIREGGRKNGYWRIIDKEYEGFFESPASKLEK